MWNVSQKTTYSRIWPAVVYCAIMRHTNNLTHIETCVCLGSVKAARTAIITKFQCTRGGIEEKRSIRNCKAAFANENEINDDNWILTLTHTSLTSNADIAAQTSKWEFRAWRLFIQMVIILEFELSLHFTHFIHSPRRKRRLPSPEHRSL